MFVCPGENRQRFAFSLGNGSPFVDMLGLDLSRSILIEGFVSHKETLEALLVMVYLLLLIRLK